MLDRKTINHVATLARLNIDEKEYELYGKQLYDILSEIKKIEVVECSTNDIMITSSSNINEYSNDTIGPMLSKDQIFKNVKHSNDDYIMVPKVIADAEEI